MGTINETVKTANSAIRTLLFAIVVFGAGWAGWQGYSLYNEPQKKLAEKEEALQKAQLQLEQSQQQVDKLASELAQTSEALAKRETSLRLLKMRHRIARLEVLDQTPIPDSDRVLTTLEFYEVNSDGAPLGSERQRIQLEGDRVYVECLVAKFDDQYIESNDLDRATAICLFQRIFGEYQEPQDGVSLDQNGSRPTSYERGGQMSEFEQRIWADFWQFAADPSKAAEIGIRAAHADAPSTRVEKGKTYQLEMRSTGEFTLGPLVESSN